MFSDYSILLVIFLIYLIAVFVSSFAIIIHSVKYEVRKDIFKKRCYFYGAMLIAILFWFVILPYAYLRR